MEIIIENNEKTQAFVQIFQNMKAFTDAVSIILKDDKMYVQGMDNAHVSMFELSMMKSWFDDYKIEKEVVLGINVAIFIKILGTHKPTQKIILTKHVIIWIYISSVKIKSLIKNFECH